MQSERGREVVRNEHLVTGERRAPWRRGGDVARPGEQYDQSCERVGVADAGERERRRLPRDHRRLAPRHRRRARREIGDRAPGVGVEIGPGDELRADGRPAHAGELVRQRGVTTRRRVERRGRQREHDHGDRRCHRRSPPHRPRSYDAPPRPSCGAARKPRVNAHQSAARPSIVHWRAKTARQRTPDV
jgi:hypothetical protein